jgi:hypothetical protein
MKLLTKQQVNTEVQTQRKMQIDEGLTLAKKVDALREKLASLETQQKKFFENMDSELHLRFDWLYNQIADKERELKELNERRNKFLENPENVQKMLLSDLKDFEGKKAELAKNQAKLTEKEQKTIENAQKAKELLFKARTREKEVERVYDRADQVRIETEKKYVELINKEENIDKLFQDKTKEMEEKEKSLSSHEFTLKVREEHIVLREEELANERIRLADQRATLERAMQRL